MTSAGTTSYSYDAFGRLTSVVYPDLSVDSFSYNGVGARVGASGAGGARTFRRAGASVLASVLGDGMATYTPGISERRGGASRFFHAGIKSFDAQTDSAGAIAATRRYDAFGNTLAGSGPWASPFAHGGPFGYQSDPDTGLQLIGHRYYDSSLGRFLSRDPAEDGRNWHTYCWNNPVSLVDPDGRQAHDSVSAYTKNLWRTLKDPKEVIDHIEALLGTGGLSRKRVKNLKKTLEWAQEVNERWEDIQNIIELVEGGKGMPHGVKGGRPWVNDRGQLPQGDYREYDIRPRGKGGRGTWRLIRDRKTGKWWFTDDHYDSLYGIN
jgi:RHS repeat-associated protein